MLDILIRVFETHDHDELIELAYENQIFWVDDLPAQEIRHLLVCKFRSETVEAYA